MDLALTVTHFRHSRLTYAVLFGCPLSVEGEIIRRISRTRIPEASHPLLLAGILAELERSRHVASVERMIDKLENRIFELEFSTSDNEQELEEEKARRQQEKRDDYLDTAYLRNSLVSWRNQLTKILDQAQDLEKSEFGTGAQVLTHFLAASNETLHSPTSNVENGASDFADEIAIGCGSRSGTAWIPNARMRRAGRKIMGRLQAIIDEYDDKIRDCSMRLDGMAMSTQWVGLEIFSRLRSLYSPGDADDMDFRHKARPTLRLRWLQAGTPSTCDPLLLSPWSSCLGLFLR